MMLPHLKKAIEEILKIHPDETLESIHYSVCYASPESDVFWIKRVLLWLEKEIPEPDEKIKIIWQEFLSHLPKVSS